MVEGVIMRFKKNDIVVVSWGNYAGVRGTVCNTYKVLGKNVVQVYCEDTRLTQQLLSKDKNRQLYLSEEVLGKVDKPQHFCDHNFDINIKVRNNAVVGTVKVLGEDKQAKVCAICAPEDEFNLDTGLNVLFDRLNEALPEVFTKSTEKPNGTSFNVGDHVYVSNPYGTHMAYQGQKGVVTEVFDEFLFKVRINGEFFTHTFDYKEISPVVEKNDFGFTTGDRVRLVRAEEIPNGKVGDLGVVKARTNMGNCRLYLVDFDKNIDDDCPAIFWCVEESLEHSNAPKKPSIVYHEGDVLKTKHRGLYVKVTKDFNSEIDRHVYFETTNGSIGHLSPDKFSGKVTESDAFNIGDKVELEFYDHDKGCSVPTIGIVRDQVKGDRDCVRYYEVVVHKQETNETIKLERAEYWLKHHKELLTKDVKEIYAVNLPHTNTIYNGECIDMYGISGSYPIVGYVGNDVPIVKHGAFYRPIDPNNVLFIKE